jgi:hypothetical protein
VRLEGTDKLKQANDLIVNRTRDREDYGIVRQATTIPREMKLKGKK